MANKIATREAYGKTLAKLAEEVENIVVLDADLSKSTKTADFKKVAEDRFFNMGIAEGNMMGVANEGSNKEGYKPQTNQPEIGTIFSNKGEKETKNK